MATRAPILTVFEAKFSLPDGSVRAVKFVSAGLSDLCNAANSMKARYFVCKLVLNDNGKMTPIEHWLLYNMATAKQSAAYSDSWTIGDPLLFPSEAAATMFALVKIAKV